MAAPTPPPQQQQDALLALNLLSQINKLNLKAFSAKSKKALIFTILNDTVQAVRYDRAVLLSFEGNSPTILGVSGQSSFESRADLARRWTALVKDLQDIGKPQILTQDSFSKEKRLWLETAEASPKPNVLWMPIVAEGKQHLGLWLERWNNGAWANQEGEILGFLMQAYGLAWDKFIPKFNFKFLKNPRLWIVASIITLALLSIRIPLRVVAPCEVVPKDPILITAPLEDIVAKIEVKPGEKVKKDDILFEYDKRVATESLRAAIQQTEVAQRDLNRAKTLGLSDDKALTEISVLAAKLKKEQVNLSLAKYRFSQLTVKAPNDGTVMIEDPDTWRGKPVQVGEKIMMLINPNKTKIRIWIPESDNVALDPKRNIRVILNIDPEKTREAKLLYISNAGTISDKHLPSFIAEADWIEQPTDVKPGLKGTAVLYGENISLFYWIIRKPWSYFRNFTGF